MPFMRTRNVRSAGVIRRLCSSITYRTVPQSLHFKRFLRRQYLLEYHKITKAGPKAFKSFLTPDKGFVSMNHKFKFEQMYYTKRLPETTGHPQDVQAGAQGSGRRNKSISIFGIPNEDITLGWLYNVLTYCIRSPRSELFHVLVEIILRFLVKKREVKKLVDGKVISASEAVGIAAIITWLQKKLGDKPITPYEVNTRTTEILFHLAECNEMRDHDIALVIDDLKLKTKETAAAANFLKEFLLESIGPSFTNLSRSGDSYMNELIESALLLEVKDTSLTSFMLEINDLSSKLHEVENKNHSMEHEILNMKKKFTEALALEKSLKEDLLEAEKQCAAQEEKMASRANTLQFLEQKRSDAVSRIQAAESCLAASGDDPSLHHQSLVALSEKLSKLQAQSVPMRKKLESYLDLSPNLFIAQAKVDEAKRELEAIEAELAEKVDMMGSALPEQVKWRFN